VNEHFVHSFRELVFQWNGDFLRTVVPFNTRSRSGGGVFDFLPYTKVCANVGESTALIQVVKGSIVLSKSSKPLRAGWAEAAAAVCAHGNFNLMMGEFGNADDAELRW